MRFSDESDEEPAPETPVEEVPIDEGNFEHLLTHKPADPDHCETCMRAKSRNVKKFAGSLKRDPTSFGDLNTFEHMGM